MSSHYSGVDGGGDCDETEGEEEEEGIEEFWWRGCSIVMRGDGRLEGNHGSGVKELDMVTSVAE